MTAVRIRTFISLQPKQKLCRSGMQSLGLFLDCFE